MAGSGVNLATTRDGGSYNKLQRPENYLMPATAPAPPPKALLPEALALTYTSKRKREHDGGVQRNQRTKLERESEETLRSRPGSTSKERSRGTECGMRTILPGLDDESHSSDEDVSEALAYLRSVRSEAWAIPQLLVGSTTHSHLDREHDQHVLFREGTCLAVDDPHSIRLRNYDSEEESIAIDPEDRFYELLLKRFYQLRSTLANIAKEKDSRRIPNTQTASDKTYLQTRSEHTWSDSIGQAHPTADQVVQLGSAIVYARLQCCANTLDHATSLSPKTSSWIWSLLASIGDVGTLDNEKISRVRDLALKAGLMSHRLRKASTGDEVSSIRVGVDAKKTHIPEASTCEQGFPGDAGDVGDMNSAPEDSKSLQDSTLLYKNGNVEGSKTPLGPALGQHNSQYARASPTSESESGAEMSVSGDEEQVYALQASDPDQARARLLLQLGDRLVHAQPLPSAISSRTAPEDQYLCDPEQHMAKPLPVQNSSGSTTQVDENDHGSKGVAGRKLDGSAGNGVDQNTQVTIDMILTVAAECFGQKDLLKYRNRW